jgi:hypothetical protein
MVIYSNRFLNLFDRSSGRIEGMTLWPFIILRRDVQSSPEARFIINHEKIHISQQAELFVLFFIFVYAFEYFNGRIKGYSSAEAYRNIRFEREAYTYMYDLQYLKNRKFLAYRKINGDKHV